MFTEKGRLNELANKDPDVQFICEKTAVLGSVWFGFDFILLNKEIKAKLLDSLNLVRTINIESYIFVLNDIIDEKIIEIPMNGFFLFENTLKSGYIEFRNRIDLYEIINNINKEQFIYNYVNVEKEKSSTATYYFTALHYKNKNKCSLMMV